MFRKDQQLYVYFEVYDPTSDEAKLPAVAAEVTLYRGARKVYESPSVEVKKLLTAKPGEPQARPGVVPVNLQIPLAQIPTGQYTIQVNVFDEAGKKFAFPRNTVIILPEQSTAAAASAGSGSRAGQPVIDASLIIRLRRLRAPEPFWF